MRAIGHWPRGLGLLGALLREPRPLRLRKISEDPRSIGFPPHHPPMSSFLGVPVRLGDRILGNFYLTGKLGAEEFSREDEDIIVIFASHAALAIENARRFTETRRRLDQTLLEIQRSERRARYLAELSALLPIGPIVEQIPWEAVADRRFLDESWDTIHRMVVANGHSLFVSRLEAPALPDPPVGLDPTLMRREKLSAAMVVPDRSRDKTYGAFASLGSTPMSFSKDDLTFGVLIADRLGVALQNAELIAQLKAAVQARAEFVSIATHELKTPTTVLKGYAQALLGRAASSSPSIAPTTPEP